MPRVYLLSQVSTLDGDERFYITNDPTGSPSDAYVTAATLAAYAASGSSGLLTVSNNLSDVANVPTARTNLGLGTMAIQNALTVAITGGSIVGITDITIADGGTGASDAPTARTNLGLGTISTQAASSISITGGSIIGIVDLAITDGGTGASTALIARANLGLGSMSTQTETAVTITGGSITGIVDLAIADGGTGASTAMAARVNLGLGTIATQADSAITITGGSITGITDLAVADGGTGASTAADARTNLGVDASYVYVAATGATRNIDMDVGFQELNMDQNCAFTITNKATAGQVKSTLVYITGAFTPTLDANMDFGATGVPTYANGILLVLTSFDNNIKVMAGNVATGGFTT